MASKKGGYYVPPPVGPLDDENAATAPPSALFNIRKNANVKKRAIEERFFEEAPSSSPSKRPRTAGPFSRGVKVRRPFGPEPPPSEDITNEDSSLMDLINQKHPPQQSFSFGNSVSLGDQTPSFSTPSPSSTSSSSPARHSASNTISSNSPLSVYYGLHTHHQGGTNSNPGFMEKRSAQTPTTAGTKRRQQLTPVPVVSSPAWGTNTRDADQITSFVTRKDWKKTEPGSKARSSRAKLEDKFDVEVEWRKSPCLDWSLKKRLLITTNKPFGWNSTSLKCSEESSGTSAFTRCIDFDPVVVRSKSADAGGSQLDTSLGAQFHQCCLYWQHPNLPSVTLFPREVSQHNFSSQPLNGLRFEEKILESMLTEWIDAFRSVFNLLRTRQCPYFYVCSNQFTSLFCAAGTQGLDYIQVYTTPSTKGLRESLKTEGSDRDMIWQRIDFSMPCHNPGRAPGLGSKNGTESPTVDNPAPNLPLVKDEESDEEADKWLDEMGISQDLSISLTVRNSPTSTAEEKSKSTLICIAGTSNALAFFNFLINSKSLIVAPAGPFAGIPPSILSPVAFHGATMKTLKVKQSKAKGDKGDTLFSIEMIGPILPHVMHTICPLLSKTVQDFKINTDTLGSTVNLNLNARGKSPDSLANVNVFELQNLSDCGLRKSVLELFCRPDSVGTITENIECKNQLYSWS